MKSVETFIMNEEKSKKTEQQVTKDLNKDKGNLDEPITNVVDYGEIPNNTPKDEKNA